MNKPPRFVSYADVLAYLDGLGLFHMDMGLGRMRRALSHLGLTAFPCPAVQIVGTNGKGSTASFLQSLGMAHGLRVGLYTSPHFLEPTERIRLNRTPLPESAWPEAAARALAAEPGLTYFELLTVMAALTFRDAEPDLLVFEAGLGGRFDATSALPADIVCFTPIDLDHQHVLGPDIAAIATDKADALRPGVRLAVSAPQKPEAWAVLAAKAQSLHIPLVLAEPNLPADAILGLSGPHQRINAATALTVWQQLCEILGTPSSEAAVLKGLAEAFIPGRLQRVEADGQTFLLDGAHNPHGMHALAKALADAPPVAVIFACLGDKQPGGMAALIRSIARGAPIFTVPIPHNERAIDAETLAALIGPEALPAPSLAAAIAALSDNAHALLPSGLPGPILICGSLYLLAEFFTLFPHALQPPRQAASVCGPSCGRSVRKRNEE